MPSGSTAAHQLLNDLQALRLPSSPVKLEFKAWSMRTRFVVRTTAVRKPWRPGRPAGSRRLRRGRSHMRSQCRTMRHCSVSPIAPHESCRLLKFDTTRVPTKPVSGRSRRRRPVWRPANFATGSQWWRDKTTVVYRMPSSPVAGVETAALSTASCRAWRGRRVASIIVNDDGLAAGATSLAFATAAQPNIGNA